MYSSWKLNLRAAVVPVGVEEADALRNAGTRRVLATCNTFNTQFGTTDKVHAVPNVYAVHVHRISNTNKKRKAFILLLRLSVCLTWSVEMEFCVRVCGAGGVGWGGGG